MDTRRIEYQHDVPFDDNKPYVIYWLQQTQRIHENHALERAITLANHLDKPLKVIMIVDQNYIYANARNMTFVIDGFKSLARQLKAMGIVVKVEFGPFEMGILSHLCDAAAFIMDSAYIRQTRKLKQRILYHAKSNAIHTEIITSNVIVPVAQASDKLETAARTLRPKLNGVVEDYIAPLKISELLVKKGAIYGDIDTPTHDLVRHMNIKQDIQPLTHYKGGENEALKRLEWFITHKLDAYDSSNDPSSNAVSRLSPYLHYGMISPMLIYRKVNAASVKTESKNAFLEQLVVRRELAFNFTYYEQNYDCFDKMIDGWVQKTLDAHKDDPRPYTYTMDDYTKFNTHDPYFNAAMKEMVKTGHMHNYMRMYWGKKIIEWSKTYKEAYQTMIYLNNHYFLDGRDPNSYAGVAWCFGKHDHGWKERAVFGKLRYMNASGLKRKFNINAYVKKMDEL